MSAGDSHAGDRAKRLQAMSAGDSHAGDRAKRLQAMSAGDSHAGDRAQRLQHIVIMSYMITMGTLMKITT